jgi:hypothetical protein
LFVVPGRAGFGLFLVVAQKPIFFALLLLLDQLDATILGLNKAVSCPEALLRSYSILLEKLNLFLCILYCEIRSLRLQFLIAETDDKVLVPLYIRNKKVQPGVIVNIQR